MAFVRTAISTSGTLTNGSANITSVANTTGIYVGMCLYGVGIQSDTIVNSIAGSTITMSKNATASGSTVITGQYIIQSGTDADPSGLTAITGVTTTDSGTGNARRLVINLGTNQLRLQGTLTHDPDLFEIVSGLQVGVQLETGCVYNYGIARVVNSQTTYSKGTGLVSTYSGGQFTNFGIIFQTGTLNWNGGVIKTFGSILHTGTSIFSNSYDSVWQMWNTADSQWRAVTGVPAFNAITMQGVGANILLFLNNGWVNLGVKFERCLFQTPAGGGANRTILNPIFTGNQATADIFTNQATGTQQIITTKNPDRFPVYGKLQNTAYCDFPVTETLTLNVNDSASLAVGASEVVAYIKDSNNGARLNTGVSNYVNDRTYIAVSNSSGVISMGDILTMVGVNANLINGTINYDYRGNFGNNNADFNIYFGGYLYNPSVTRQTLLGNNGVSTKWTMFNDTNVTLTRTNALAKLASSFIVNATTKTITVTANSTYDDLYDIAKAWKYNGTQTNAETPTISDLVISASGTNLTAASTWTLVVNTGVTLNQGVKFTKVKFDTITINGTGAITGIYETTVGTSTIWEFGATAEPIIAGTSLAIYDSTGTTKYYNAVTSDGVYRYYIAPQSTGATYTYAIERYGYKREEGTFPSNAGGILFYVPSYGEDVGITEATKSTVQAYTTLADTAQIYDATANFRLSETGIKLGQLVARDGTYLDFGNFNVKIKDDASAIVAVVSGTITYKSIVINESTKYNAMKATPPKTITPTDTEIINVLIEDANGDSKLAILGGDNLGYELWKVTTATATDDYATGTLLDTLTTNDEVFRFIGISGFDIVGRDISSGVRRRTSMLKGSYEQAFYVGNQIQLATDAPQLIENNEKLAEVILKLDTNLDAKVSTRLADADYIDPATAQDVWEYTTRTLTSAGASGATLAEIEGSLILAKEATSQDIKTKVLTLNNYDDTTTQTKLDAIGTMVNDLPTLSEIEGSAVFGEISGNTSSTYTLVEQIAGNDFDTMNDSLDAISTKVDEIKAKTDILVNTDLTGIATSENVTDAKDEIILEIQNNSVDLSGIATTDDVTTAKDEIITELGNIDVDNVAIANEVWNQEPERLKQVSTVETTGDQLASFNNA